jgi:geranylgeranyl diphosphate synthase type I
MKKQSSKKTIILEIFIETTKKDLEKKITEMITDKHILSILEGGKRLRPLLANLTFKSCTRGKESVSEYQRALEGGVVIELAHAASLVHDDIIDDDRKRRGKPAYFVKNGVASAILTGHKMLVMGFNVALKHGDDWAKLYVDSWDEVIDGEIDEIKLNKKGFNFKDIESKSKIFDKYIHIIDFKTAALFSSVCKAGVLEANKSGKILDVFSDYGREIGLAYQLADDLVDLEKGEMIDSVIVPLLNRLDGNKMKIKSYNKILIKSKFSKNKEKIQKIYLEEIKKHIINAEKLSNSKEIPDSPYKELIKYFPRFIINEMLKEINISI